MDEAAQDGRRLDGTASGAEVPAGGAVPAAGVQPTAEVSHGPARRPRTLARRAGVTALVVAGLAGVAGGGTSLALELTARATPAQASAALRTEIASRWQRLGAGQIFPARIGYLTSNGLRRTALRAGIARPAPCAAALDPPVARLLRTVGCRTVLRATYVSASGALAATLGVAVLPDAAAGQRLQDGNGPAGGWLRSGVRPAAIPGTVAGAFRDTSSQAFGAQIYGPYVFLVTAGYADGRPANSGARDAQPFTDLVTHLAGPTVAVLTAGGNPCARKDIRC